MLRNLSYGFRSFPDPAFASTFTKIKNRPNCHDRINFRSRFSTDLGNGPLTGIRVLDMTRILAGPFCTMLLGDLGAEVIKVELPVTGDDTRSWSPPKLGNESCYFLSLNRNKKSIAIDMKTSEGIDIIKKLASISDVLVENFVPGKLDSMGLGFEDLKLASPKLIYCSITGYGITGPSSHKPGYDSIVAATGGLMHITGTMDNEPCKVGVAITDTCTGLYAHGAIMAAILQRQRTGRGQRLDCNLLSTQVATLSNAGSNYLNAGLEGRKWGTAHESIVPYQAFKAKNGHIVIGAGNDKQFEDLCERMNLKELIEDERFTTNSKRVKHRDVLLDILNRRLSEHTVDEWLVLFKNSKFPCGPVNSLEKVFKDPQVLHNKMVVEMEHATAGMVKVMGPAVGFSEGGNFCRSAPPTLGQHTDHVLRDILKLPDDVVKHLKTSKVVH